MSCGEESETGMSLASLKGSKANMKLLERPSEFPQNLYVHIRHVTQPKNM